VANAVGLLSIGDLQIEVRPKIPMSHLLYLFGESGQFPRMDEQMARAMTGASLWELVAKWYLVEMEGVLRKDLMRDYQEAGGWLKVIRGRVDPVRTVLALNSGRVEALCEFEEFGANTALNRILLAGARHVGASSTLPRSDRRRALSIAARMDDVTAIRPGDERVRTDRRTAYYENALGLARHIIAGQGRTIGAGAHYARTFLIRTPEMVEEGIRRILKRRLADRWRIEKKGRQLIGSSLTFNPDLVVDDGFAIADVKYKWTDKDWVRSDLYQTVAFAVEYRTRVAALVGFRRSESGTRDAIHVGEIRIDSIDWDASENLSPKEAAERLSNEVDAWLSASISEE
jgi:5-methylcytosine-specific restriction endonuclease McrBC regulatory subunit McrC